MIFKEINLPEIGIHLYESKHKDGEVIHQHHHAIHQILYTIEGKGKISLDGRTYDITQDEAVLIVPNSTHSILSDSRLTTLVLAFDIHSLGTLDGLAIECNLFHTSQFIQPNPISSSELRQLLRKMLYEQSSNSYFSGLALKTYLHQILLMMARAGENPYVKDTNTHRCEWIKNYIENYYYEPLTSKDIAVKLGFSTRYMNSIFKEYYHITPIQYLTEVRIEVSKKLLIESNKDIVTICFEVGYETLSTFYRTFKNVMNMTPNQYRMIHQLEYQQQ